jgi:hypothetical protein
MNTDNFNDLPDWDDSHLRGGDDDESWKPGSTRTAAKALYAQWQQVFFLLKGITGHLAGDDNQVAGADAEREMLAEAARNMIGDAMIAGAKIRGSEAGNMYVLRMENAAIIRKCAADIYASLLLFMHDPEVDGEHIAVIRKEIDKFRELFIYWVCSFEKDEFADEWGLFI